MKKLLQIFIVLCLLALAGNGWGAGPGGQFGFGSSQLRIGRESGFSFSTLDIFKFEVINTQTIAGNFRTKAGRTITVDWGDGTSSSYSGTANQAYSKNYGSVGSRTVKIKNSAALIYFDMTTVGANISFDIARLPRDIYALYILGNNTVYGDIGRAPPALTYIYISGNNTISGNIGSELSGIVTFRINGANTISGNVGDIPSSITYFYLTGSNTLTGDIALLKSTLPYFYCRGDNLLYGDVGDIPALMTLFVADGSSTIDEYTSRSWPANMNTINLQGIGGLSSEEIDQLLIDLSLTTWTSLKDVDLTGTNNAARTSASDAAVTALQGMGVTVITNDGISGY